MTVAELKKWRDERQCHGTKGPKGYTTAENAAWLMGGGKLSDKDAKAYLKLRDAALKHLHEIEAAKQNNKHIRGDTKLWLALRKLETRIEALEKELKDALQKRA